MQKNYPSEFDVMSILSRESNLECEMRVVKSSVVKHDSDIKETMLSVETLTDIKFQHT